MLLYLGRNAYNTPDQDFNFYGWYATKEAIQDSINAYCDRENFKSYYWRRIADKDFEGKPLFIIDFGSWSRFFYIRDLSGELLEDWKKLYVEVDNV